MIVGLLHTLRISLQISLLWGGRVGWRHIFFQLIFHISRHNSSISIHSIRYWCWFWWWNCWFGWCFCNCSWTSIGLLFTAPKLDAVACDTLATVWLGNTINRLIMSFFQCVCVSMFVSVIWENWSSCLNWLYRFRFFFFWFDFVLISLNWIYTVLCICVYVCMLLYTELMQAHGTL